MLQAENLQWQSYLSPLTTDKEPAVLFLTMLLCLLFGVVMYDSILEICYLFFHFTGDYNEKIYLSFRRDFELLNSVETIKNDGDF